MNDNISDTVGFSRNGLYWIDFSAPFYEATNAYLINAAIPKFDTLNQICASLFSSEKFMPSSNYAALGLYWTHCFWVERAAHNTAHSTPTSSHTDQNVIVSMAGRPVLWCWQNNIFRWIQIITATPLQKKPINTWLLMMPQLQSAGSGDPHSDLFGNHSNSNTILCAGSKADCCATIARHTHCPRMLPLCIPRVWHLHQFSGLMQLG